MTRVITHDCDSLTINPISLDIFYIVLTLIIQYSKLYSYTVLFYLCTFDLKTKQSDPNFWDIFCKQLQNVLLEFLWTVSGSL